MGNTAETHRPLAIAISSVRRPDGFAVLPQVGGFSDSHESHARLVDGELSLPASKPTTISPYNGRMRARDKAPLGVNQKSRREPQRNLPIRLEGPQRLLITLER